MITHFFIFFEPYWLTLNFECLGLAQNQGFSLSVCVCVCVCVASLYTCLLDSLIVALALVKIMQKRTAVVFHCSSFDHPSLQSLNDRIFCFSLRVCNSKKLGRSIYCWKDIYKTFPLVYLWAQNGVLLCLLRINDQMLLRIESFINYSKHKESGT